MISDLQINDRSLKSSRRHRSTPFYLQKLRLSFLEWLRPMSWWTRNDLSESLNIRKWYFHVILCRHLSKHPLGGITLLFMIIIIITTSNPKEGYRNISMIQFQMGIRSDWPGNQFSLPGFMINFIRIRVNEVSNNNDYFPFPSEIQFTRSKFHYTRKWNY